MSQPAVQLFGTDLGCSFVHQGKHMMLFGDTMPTARFYCDNHDITQDDSTALLPLAPPAKVPEPSFVTVPGDPSTYATLEVNRDGRPLPMGLGRTPVTGWSDGQRAYAMFGHQEYTTCRRGADGGLGCDAEEGLTCSHDVGTCTPVTGNVTTPCDLTRGQGCGLGQQCTPSPDGYCVDLTCSQYDGTPSSVAFTVARNTEIAVQREGDPAVFDSVHTFTSKKFHYAFARTVTHLAEKRRDDDFTPGDGTLLLWGRPGFVGEQGRQSQLYLLKHALPLPVTAGTLAFAPEYFAGVDPVSGEPRWSHRQRDAAAIALDGKHDGSPFESISIVNQFAISWLGPPVRKWIMLYAGDVPDQLLLDPSGADVQRTRGPVRVRFADFPWGPFSPAVDYLVPGDPNTPFAPYGPGGFLFHYACQDQPGTLCARTDPLRPLDSYIPGCPTPAVQLDIGRLYGVNIIDAYTVRADDGLVVTWNVSTWNPYGVMMMRSHIAP